MKNKVEARFSSYPYLCVCERTTQLTQTLWDVDSRAKYIVEIQFPMDNSEIHTHKKNRYAAHNFLCYSCGLK